MAKCFTCKSVVGGTWRLVGGAGIPIKQDDTISRYQGVEKGRFLNSGSPDYVNCYCFQCFKKEIIQLASQFHTETARAVEQTEKKIAQITPEVASLLQQKEQLANQITILSKQKAKFEAEVSPLQKQNTQLNKDKDNLQAQKTGLTTEVTSLQEQKTQLTDMVTSLQILQAQLTKEVTILQETKTQIPPEINKLQQQKTQLATEVSTLSKENNILQEKVKDLKEQHEKVFLYTFFIPLLTLRFFTPRSSSLLFTPPHFSSDSYSCSVRLKDLLE